MPSTIQRIVDIVAVTAAIGLIGGAGWHAYSVIDQHRKMKKVSDGLARFNQILAFQAASGQAQTTSRGWPTTVDPLWFGDSPPTNPLVSKDRPWVEVATVDQSHLDHPSIRVTLDPTQAMFWYNPFRGVVRARVPMKISDERTLSLYNEANGTALRTLYDTSTPPAPAEAAEADRNDAEAAGHDAVEAPEANAR